MCVRALKSLCMHACVCIYVCVLNSLLKYEFRHHSILMETLNIH